jgi:hypothetical protein
MTALWTPGEIGSLGLDLWSQEFGDQLYRWRHLPDSQYPPVVLGVVFSDLICILIVSVEAQAAMEKKH